ncbi:MAG: hypothetical protein M1835_000813 [Candelina submexicana]|nr:MAG: hypothetical protein M1835_000813 [Candelina submexicana]
MSSSSSSTPVTSKSVNTLPQTTFPGQSQASSSAGDNSAQRRSGGPGGFGGGSASRTSVPSARNNQSFRKQNKNQRKPRLADEDANAESAAMKSVNSRKGQTSITHLMNFSLPPRPQNYHQNHSHGRNGRKNPSWGLGSGYHAVDKARYVHANYRFIVNPKGDYHAQAVDADVHLDWTTVLQILASAQTQSASCPICLSTPTAPRMAKCGHIFCLPCLIRYMHSTEDTHPMPEKKARSKKCPICWDSVYLSEARPVRWFVGQEDETPQEGGDIVLRLVMRQSGSTLALPRDLATAPSKAEDIPWFFAAEVMDYARVMKGTEDYMVSQYDGEIEKLQQLEREDELMFGEETEWTRKAVHAIREAKEKVKGIGNPPNNPVQSSYGKSRKQPIQFHETDADVPEMYFVQHAAKSGQSSSNGSSTPRNSTAQTNNNGSTMNLALSAGKILDADPPHLDQKVSLSPPPRSVVHPTAQVQRNSLTTSKPAIDFPYYFYQALVHYYLSPLDIRILKCAFGDFAAFPATILPRVERVSTGHIVDEDMRKRAKYLAHLPYGCEVGFLECNWTDIVAPEVLANFKVDIEKRRRKNQDKEMREEKERAKAEREEDDKRWAAARRKRSTVRRESFSNEDVSPPPAAEIAMNGILSAIDISDPSTSPPWSSSRVQHGSAFASLASPSTSPVAARTVWGTTAVAPSSPTLPALTQVKKAPGDDGWLQDWERDLLQEDDLVAQIEATSLGGIGASNGASGGPGTGKKKKGKKITLMSTNARRGA